MNFANFVYRLSKKYSILNLKSYLISTTTTTTTATATAAAAATTTTTTTTTTTNTYNAQIGVCI